MSTFSKLNLSGSVNGKGITVVDTDTPGTLIHTAVAGEASWDEIWLYACNIDTVDRLLTIEFGGVIPSGDVIKVTVAAQSGLMLVVPGLILQNECVVGAYASAADMITIVGFVNEIVG